MQTNNNTLQRTVYHHTFLYSQGDGPLFVHHHCFHTEGTSYEKPSIVRHEATHVDFRFFAGVGG